MSSWKELLHDELDGLPRREQINILIDNGWSTPEEAAALLERQHIRAREENDADDT